MQNTLSYETLIQDAALQIGQGAFLMTGREEKNPMTIGWGQWGKIWSLPICTVMVRQSRYSHSLLERDGVFTVCVPPLSSMKQELGFCGTKSGRDFNKLEELGLTTLPSRTGGVDALCGCALHFECRVVFKLEMAGHLDDLAQAQRAQYYDIAKQAGEDGDPHTVYFGEILAAYRAED